VIDQRNTRTAAHKLLLACATGLGGLFMFSCSLAPNLPVVNDEPIERLVRGEAAVIVAVTPDKSQLSRYRFFLSDFPRKDILGLSVGERRIYISYDLARLALRSSHYRWLLRQTLAHEIAHEIAGHAKQREVHFNSATPGRGITSRDIGLPSHLRFQHYSAQKERQADLEGMKYWSKLDWDCRIWIRILENFKKQQYAGDIFHPTDERLQQASRVCLDQSSAEQKALRSIGFVSRLKTDPGL
jgi:predicted Zn-dependent protease